MKRLLPLVSVLLLGSKANATYASSRWVTAIQSSLPAIASPQLAPIVEALGALDPKSQYARDVMGRVVLHIHGDAEHYSDFMALTPQERANVLEKALSYEAEIQRREADEYLGAADDPALTLHEAVLRSAGVESLLLYSAPFMDAERKGKLVNAYVKIHEEVEIWRSQISDDPTFWDGIRKRVETTKDPVVENGINVTALMRALDRTAVLRHPSSRRDDFNFRLDFFKNQHVPDIEKRFAGNAEVAQRIERVFKLANQYNSKPDRDDPSRKQMREFLAEFAPLSRVYRLALVQAGDEFKGWVMSIDRIRKYFEELLY